MDNTKESIKKIQLELENEYGKVAGHKISMQKSIFLYTSNEQSKMKLTIPLKIASKNKILKYKFYPCALKTTKNCCKNYRTAKHVGRHLVFID